MNLILRKSSRTKSMMKTMHIKSKKRVAKDKNKMMNMSREGTLKIGRRIHPRREMVERRPSQV